MKRFVFFCGILLGFAQCNFNDLEINDPELERYQGVVAFPLGELTYAFRDIIEDVTDSTINLEESDSLFTMVFRDTVIFTASDDLVLISDNRNTALISLPTTPPVASTTVIAIDESYTFTFPTDGGEQLDSLVHSAGVVSFNISSTLPSTFQYQFTLENTRDLNQEEQVTFNGSVSSGTTLHSRQLANHSTTLERGTNFNLFQASISGNIVLAPGQEITNTDVINLEVLFEDQSFTAAFGDFGTKVVEVGRKESAMPFFEQFGSGVRFGEPTMDITVDNSYGVPMGFQLGSIFGSAIAEDGTPLTVQLGGPITESNVPVAAPTEQQLGDSLTTSFQINTGNSDIREFFAFGPSTLGLAFDAQLNSPAASGRNFFTGTSSLRSTVEVRMPFTVQLEDVEFVVPYPYPALKEPGADSVVLRFVTENELPLNATLGIEIYDGADLLYTVPEQLFLATPFLTRDGLVSEGEVNISNMPLDREGIEAFKQGDRVDLIMTFNSPETSNSQEIYVDLFNQYVMEVKASVLIKSNLPIKF